MIRLSQSDVGEGEMQAIMKVLQKGFLGMGPEVQAFEQELTDFFGGAREVVCVNTGTAALHLAVQACGLGPGDEVLLPSLTYVASFQAVSATGATPVACDIDEGSLTLDPTDMEMRITPRTKAVMPVHYASGLGKLDRIYRIARKHELRIIEDAAHAFGCTRNGERVGSFGDVVCFSFDGIKNITSGEGGAVVTGDREVAERVRNARLLGVQKDTEQRFKGARSWDFDVAHQGWRYHMSDLMAAIGRVQLTRYPEFAETRCRLARLYDEILSHNNKVQRLGLDYGPIVPHIYPIMVPAERRDSLRSAIDAAGAQTGIHYKPNHLLTYFKDNAAVGRPVAERVFERLLTLPLHTRMGPVDVRSICDVVNKELS